MRLTCPNCGAEYEVPDGMVPEGGKHVQCTGCQTRWFVRGAVRPQLSEAQVLHRLEAWKPRAVEEPGAPPEPAQEPDAADAEAGAEVEEAESPVETVETEPAGSSAEVEPAPGDATDPATALPAGEQPRRSSGRLSVTPEATAAAPALAAPPPSRYGRGLAVALFLFALAFVTYYWADEIAAAMPAAEPPLRTYAGWIDGLREWVDTRLAAPRNN